MRGASIDRHQEISIHELELFLEFARTEHLGRAAETLDLSVAAVQRGIRSLEERLGVPLFARDGRRLRLLHTGRVFADHAARVLQSRDDAVDAVMLAAGRADEVVRIGYLYSLGMRVVPDLIALLKTREPQTRIVLKHGSTETLVGGVLAGQLDAICVAPLPEESDLATLTLFSEEMLLCVPASDPLGTRVQVDLRSVRDRPFAMLRQGFGTRTYMFEACARAGFRPQPTYETDDIFTLEGLVGAGLAVSVMPSRMRDHGNSRVRYVALAPSCSTQRTVGVAYRKGVQRHRALAALLTIARTYVPD
ncbi:MAG: LysR family transcriptional regulator [Vulcanimicrobiaceae bacterium]